MVILPLPIAQGAWGFGRYWPCAIGKGKITTNKKEGDGATPAGILRVTGCLYRADRITKPVPWARKIGPRDLWCDEPGHPSYNHLTQSPLAASHERLRRADPLYDLVLLTDWNWPNAIPGQGSAIFIHRWRKPRHPTEGCIAFEPTNLRMLSRLLKPGATIDVRK